MKYEITVTATNDDGTVTDGDRSVFTFPGSVESTSHLYLNTVPSAIQELLKRVLTRFPERVQAYEDGLKLFKRTQTRALLAAKMAEDEAENAKTEKEQTNAGTGKGDAGAGEDVVVAKAPAKTPAKS